MTPNSHQPPANILPFPEWVEKKYPKKTPAQKMLKLIGALDLAYLFYRFTTKNKKPKETPPMDSKPVKPPVVHTVKKATRPRTRPSKKTIVSPNPIPNPQELTIEFKKPRKQPIVIEHTQPVQPTPEPEPLTLEIEPEVKTSPRVLKPSMTWLDDPLLEDEDIRRTDMVIGVDGTPVTFEKRDIEEDTETLLGIGGTTWRLTMTSPALNLSRMVQTMRVSYGELYVLGRMALGALSGEGYIPADEAARVVRMLKDSQENILDADVVYYARNKTVRTRKASTIRVRFERQG